MIARVNWVRLGLWAAAAVAAIWLAGVLLASLFAWLIFR